MSTHYNFPIFSVFQAERAADRKYRQNGGLKHAVFFDNRKIKKERSNSLLDNNMVEFSNDNHLSISKNTHHKRA
ncbi:Uncharacterised protein [Segatella buccae]|uniref:Uncharacterized protein n=1 Tax=Segatella buccae TaxID=28126 RepID=A0AAQ1UJ34_9BACT|nr:Uncharacterised protein [Segatella buccae]